MPLRSRPDRLALRNDFDIHFDEMRSGGVLSDVLSLRGFIGEAEGSSEPIHPDLAAVAVPVGNGSGDYVAWISGTATDEHLRADYLHRTVWVIGESVPPGSYRDAYPVRVEENQSG